MVSGGELLFGVGAATDYQYRDPKKDKEWKRIKKIKKERERVKE